LSFDASIGYWFRVRAPCPDRGISMHNSQQPA
jgi:hypothetical protein